MGLKLYKTDGSAPVRSVYFTSRALDLNLEYVNVNLVNEEQLKPEFLKINPQHTIPTLVDDDVVIWDSHVINIYLVTKYGNANNPLYPLDPEKRAIIDQRLYFDSGILFPLLRGMANPIIYRGKKTIPQYLIDGVLESYDFLNKFLEGHTWVVGNDLTLADLQLIPTVTSLNVLVPLETTKHANIIAWIKEAEKLPYYDANNCLKHFETSIQKVLSS